MTTSPASLTNNDIIGIGRGPKGRAIREARKKYPNYGRPPTLAELFADRICGDFNKDVVFLLTGPRGSGKSMALLSLADALSREIAKRKGGKPLDYFDPLTNLAIVDPASLIEKMTNLKKYNVYVLDDASIAWNARNFATSQNKGLNDLLTICRTANAAILISVPDSAQIDKIARELGSFYGEVAESVHGRGISFIKVFKNLKLYRAGKMLHPYITTGQYRIKRFVAEMPPLHLVKMYDKVREEQVDIQSMIKKEKFSGQKPSRESQWQEKADEFGDRVISLLDQGKSAWKTSQVLGITEHAARRIAIMRHRAFP